jgi:hypothetical protein
MTLIDFTNRLISDIIISQLAFVAIDDIAFQDYRSAG